MEDTIEIPVQVNGKVKVRIKVPSGLPSDALGEAARADPQVAPLLAGVTTRKVIAVPDKLVNFVVS